MNSNDKSNNDTKLKKFEDMLPKSPGDILNLVIKKKDERFRIYAGLNRRMIAVTIDTLIASILVAPLVDSILGKFIHSREVTLEEINAAKYAEEKEIIGLFNLLSESGKLSELFIGYSAQLMALLVASAICWKIWSTTPGKMLLRMKIVDADTGQNISNRQIIMRGLWYIPSCVIFFMGIFWISFNKRHQGWHDKMANTVVIKITKEKDAKKEEVLG